MHYVAGLVQERRNSSALAIELRLSCTNPLICDIIVTDAKFEHGMKFHSEQKKFGEISNSSIWKMQILNSKVCLKFYCVTREKYLNGYPMTDRTIIRFRITQLDMHYILTYVMG